MELELRADNNSLYPECLVEENPRRWYLVAVIGTSLSLVSILTNLVIAKVLLTSRHSHFYFLALLSLSDCFLSFMYGPVIAMDIIKDKLQILWLTKLYWSYVAPLLSLCQVSMTFSCYLIILATIERYLITQRSQCLSGFRRCRGVMALMMLVLSFLLRGTLYFEIEIQKTENCTGTMEYLPGLSGLVDTDWYGTVFRFYIRNIMTVFVPFFLLAYLNWGIVWTLRKHQRKAEMFRFMSHSQKVPTYKTKIRSATRLMVLIVCSYLLANMLNVLITLWEFVAFQSTQTQEAYYFYETCTDVISVLYVLVCATRLLVYYSCNKEIRETIRQLFRSSPKSEKYGLIRSHDSVSRPVGTEIDEVAIAIARRLMSIHVDSVRHGVTDRTDRSTPESPHQAIIYANEFGKGAQLL